MASKKASLFRGRRRKRLKENQGGGNGIYGDLRAGVLHSYILPLLHRFYCQLIGVSKGLGALNFESR